jgi:hypothetical protein
MKKKKYIKLTYDELLSRCLNGELEHKHMTEDDYGLLLDYSTNRVVFDFCVVGLTKLGKYEEYTEDFKRFKEFTQKNAEQNNESQAKGKNPPENDYAKLSYIELRSMVLSGELEHEYMSESVYVYLLENETEFSNKAHHDEESYTAVIDFCATGLKRFDKYKDLSDIEIYTMFISGQVERKNIEREVLEAFYKPKRRFYSPVSVIRVVVENPKLFARAIGELLAIFYKAHKRIAVAGIAIMSIFAITLTSAALGYNFIDLIRNAINNPDRTDTDNEGNQVLVAEDTTRVYNSMSELLEFENLSILFPVKLPIGYEFTDFLVFEIETGLQIQAFSTEPYISFIVLIGANVVHEYFDYEINEIEYSIVESNDWLYQAFWSYNGDYYSIVVSDKAIISEIINNLKEY